MTKPPAPILAALQTPQVVPLGDSGALHVAPSPAGTAIVLLLTSADGTPRAQLTLQGDELVLDCFGGRTRLRMQGALTLEAEQLTLSATKDLRLQSGGDIHLQAEGNLQMQALRGDVCVTANDDVRLEGERIRMNA